MELKVLLFSCCKEFTALIREIQDEFGFDIDICEETQEAEMFSIAQSDPDKYCVYICIGYQASSLRRITGKTVLAIDSRNIYTNDQRNQVIRGIFQSSDFKQYILDILINALVICRIFAVDQELLNQDASTLADQSCFGILVFGANGDVILCNRHASKLLDISPDEAVGNSVAASNLCPLERLYWEDHLYLNKIIGINGRRLFINRIPLLHQGFNYGTLINLGDVRNIHGMEQKIRKDLYSKGLAAKYFFKDIICVSKSMTQAIENAKKFGRTNVSVLINAESGTGKELFAQSIHNISDRCEGPFVAVNCAALPTNLLESELFGYEDGAFTGAKKGGRAGLFELANTGTIFLDEISEIPLDLQGRLLRVLQEHEILRIGSNSIIPIDIRVVAASNIDLYMKVREGKFREDLYFRLNILNLKIPPLRERKEDIPLLLDYFLRQFGSRLSSKTMSREAVTWLLNQGWYGNVRQLQNFAQRIAVLLDDCEWADLDAIQGIADSSACAPVPGPQIEKNQLVLELDTLERMEDRIFHFALQYCGGDRTEAARLLGVSRTTLWKRLKEPETT